jgi:hypothetical protein
LIAASISFCVIDLIQVTFPPAVYEDSFFSASSPLFVGGGVLDGNYSNRSEVEF